MEFIFRSRVYFSDTDAGGIVYHARYLDYAEHARTEMLRTLLPSLSQKAMKETSSMIFVVKGLTIDYEKPGYLDDEITVHTKVISVKHFSTTLEQVITRGDDGDELCRIVVKAATIDSNSKKLMMIPTEVASTLLSIQG